MRLHCLLSVLALASTFFIGCASAHGDGETSASVGAPLRCTTCGGDDPNSPTCDPVTSCCSKGGHSLNGSDPCEGTLLALGCRSVGTRQTTFAQAYFVDTHRTWWFATECPPGTAVPEACMENKYGGQIIDFNTSPQCSLPMPQPGDVLIGFDPTCAGCKLGLIE